MKASRKKHPEYYETLKFDLWAKYFTDKNSKETYGNATKSALKAYQTDNYSMAGVIGHKNIKKYKNMSLIFADSEGFSFVEMMKIGIAKVIKGNYQDWDKFMVRLGYFEDSKDSTGVQNNFDFSNLGQAIEDDRRERGLPLMKGTALI